MNTACKNNAGVSHAEQTHTLRARPNCFFIVSTHTQILWHIYLFQYLAIFPCSVEQNKKKTSLLPAVWAIFWTNKNFSTFSTPRRISHILGLSANSHPDLSVVLSAARDSVTDAKYYETIFPKPLLIHNQIEIKVYIFFLNLCVSTKFY